ncbi:hypothetical protein RRG08_049282 [Elysia crispata]|uniref:Uncharacterized protein n=1 Tax=Elysia crispata TaxID=231223 RepID=A0AAE0ZP48_9GAST|nr:hypothetical protein RRG08_049282 [Elysia crispata]
MSLDVRQGSRAVEWCDSVLTGRRDPTGVTGVKSQVCSVKWSRVSNTTVTPDAGLMLCARESSMLNSLQPMRKCIFSSQFDDTHT